MVLKKPAPGGEPERMIRSLVDLRAIGPETATLLVREAFVRPIANRRALGSYVGLTGTPFSSGGLGHLMQTACRTPGQIKAWSQNLGHENIAATLTSYGAIDPHRQGDVIGGMRRSL